MWWSHADAATNRAWMAQAGLTVEREEFVPEGDRGHALFWARRPCTPSPFLSERSVCVPTWVPQLS